MAKITQQQHEYDGTLEAGEKVSLFVNDVLFTEYTVTTGTFAALKFKYDEITKDEPV